MEKNIDQNFTETSLVLSKIFSRNRRKIILNTMQNIIRTSGLTNDIISFSNSPDIIIDSIYAIESTSSFINKMKNTNYYLPFIDAKNFFDDLFIIDKTKKIPIPIPKINLDDGLEKFKIKFNEILLKHINQYDKSIWDKIYQNVLYLVNDLIPIISDWIACLFPDTVGLAGDLSKMMLKYTVQNGFNYIYNLIAFLPDRMQQMITNPFEFKKLIHNVFDFTKKMLKTLDSKKIHDIIEGLDPKTSGITDSIYIKETFGSNFIIDEPKKILIAIIEKYIEPNIEICIDWFYQLFPIFLMCILFIEEF